MSESGPSRDPAGFARRLLRSRDRAALATSLRGAPYASLVLVAADLDASPLLLLSDLARHSRNIAFEPRVSLLFDATQGHPDPLAGPRLTVLGQAEGVDDRRLLARFTARHPSASLYAGFADFRLYRVVVERGQLVRGFGLIAWIEGRQLLFAPDTRALAAAEPAIVSQMNEDHGDAIELHARRLVGRPHRLADDRRRSRGCRFALQRGNGPARIPGAGAHPGRGARCPRRARRRGAAIARALYRL
jgi:heme oxygenase (biliverdin-IX-beta and delta-forming)